MHGNYWSVFERQNTACLETAISNQLVVQKTFFDYKYKFHNPRRPGFDIMLEYLERKKNIPYTIIIYNLNLINPTESELDKKLRFVRRRRKNLNIVEADIFDNHEHLLKSLGMNIGHPNFLDGLEPNQQN